MNCFQLLVSLIFWTTIVGVALWGRLLWIAFNYWYLWYSEQRSGNRMRRENCCELLSIIGIFDILNNKRLSKQATFNVVNCFQLLVSLIFWTTKSLFTPRSRGLWIAFNYWYLWYSEQPLEWPMNWRFGCELLSIIGIFDILNNKTFINTLLITVVNCFQLLVSLIFWTTINSFNTIL